MSRVPTLSSPFLLGFDEIERVLDRVVKGADGYPPYNIERCDRSEHQPERLRITLAVAGQPEDALKRFAALAGFFGPAPKPASLSPVEQYVQALLLANEFVFVD